MEGKSYEHGWFGGSLRKSPYGEAEDGYIVANIVHIGKSAIDIYNYYIADV